MNYLLLNRDKIEERIKELEEEIKEFDKVPREKRDKTWDELVNEDIYHLELLKELLTQGEDLEEIIKNSFISARTLKSGVVSNSVQHKFSHYSDYLNSLKQEEK